MKMMVKTGGIILVSGLLLAGCGVKRLPSPQSPDCYLMQSGLFRCCKGTNGFNMIKRRRAQCLQQFGIY